MPGPTAQLPRDKNGQPIQTLAIDANTASLAVAGASADVALPTGARAGDIVRVACNTDCHIAWGDNTITATTSDCLFPAGVEIMRVPAGATNLAAIRVTANGTLTINEVK